MSDWKSEKRGSDIISMSKKYGRFRLAVHKHVGCGNKLYLSCYGLFEKKELCSENYQKAICQAKALFQIELQDALDEILKMEG